MNENSKAPKSDDLDSLKRLLIQGQFAAALSRAESLSAEFPGDASTLNMLGLALMQTGQNEPALAAFARANAADPLYSAPFLNRANLLVSLGRYDEAKTACVGAFAAGPPPEDAAKAYHLLGVSLANSGNPVGAEAPFRAAIANAPNMPGAHSGLGGVLGVLKRFDEALAVLEPAAAKWTDDNGIARNLGNALIETAQYHAATRVLEAAVLRSERDAGLRMALARALRGAGRYQAALDEAEQAVALVPGSAEAQGLLGTCRQTLGDTSGAIAAYDKVLEGTPDDPTALVSRWRMTPLPPGEPAMSMRPSSTSCAHVRRVAKAATTTSRPRRGCSRQSRRLSPSRCRRWPSGNRLAAGLFSLSACRAPAPRWWNRSWQAIRKSSARGNFPISVALWSRPDGVQAVSVRRRRRLCLRRPARPTWPHWGCSARTVRWSQTRRR